MRAKRLICHSVRQIEVEDFEVGAIPDDGILVANEYTAISVGTELWSWMLTDNPQQAPGVLFEW